MKQALVYNLTLVFHHSNNIDENVIDKIKDLKNQSNYFMYDSRESRLNGKISNFDLKFLIRNNLMDFLGKLYRSSSTMGIRLVASKNKVRKPEDVYFEVRISQEFVSSDSFPELQKKQWTSDFLLLYGYAVPSYVYAGLASEYEMYKQLNHPLASEETTVITDSQGIDYTILKDSFLELW